MTQLVTMTTIDVLVKDLVTTLSQGQNVESLLKQLPALLVSLYKQVVLIYNSTPANQQMLVIQVLQQAVGKMPGLTTQELAMVDLVIANMVPKMLALMRAIESGVESGFLAAETEAKGCWAAIRARCCP